MLQYICLKTTFISSNKTKVFTFPRRFPCRKKVDEKVHKNEESEKMLKGDTKHKIRKTAVFLANMLSKSYDPEDIQERRARNFS